MEINGNGAKRMAAVIVAVALVIVGGAGAIVFAFVFWAANTIIDTAKTVTTIETNLGHETANRIREDTDLRERLDDHLEEIREKARQERFEEWRRRGAGGQP